MGNYCKLLAKIFLVIGIIGSIGLAYANGMKLEERLYSYELEGDMLLTIAWLVGGLLSTFIVCAMLDALGDILENQYYLTSSVAEIKKKLETNPSSYSSQKANVEKGEWKCTKCGRVNAGYIGTCACGTGK